MLISPDNKPVNGWINLYKPRGISSAKAVAIVKKSFSNQKVGHTGTLDLEAEGVLPIAVGEATKLVSFLIEARKTYKFTIKFGESTDTADGSGKTIETCTYIPSAEECKNITSKFIGEVIQTPPQYSALKVNGERAYKLAREGKTVNLASRKINIYDLQFLQYNLLKHEASFLCCCSKGTYIRTLGQDIALSLQSLGYVIELARLKVGIFSQDDSINVEELLTKPHENARDFLEERCLKVESILDDIPVLKADEDQIRKIKFGQMVMFEGEKDRNILWIKDKNSKIIAIGKLFSGSFKPSRVFNL